MTPPEWLADDAKAEWARMLSTGVTVPESDLNVFAAYCQNYARWKQAEKVLETEGSEIVLRDDKGNVKRVMASPHVGISRGALASMLKAASQLGLRANVTGDGTLEASQTSQAAADWFN
jgi:P27 family predicted phage terminase small subunit